MYVSYPPICPTPTPTSTLTSTPTPTPSTGPSFDVDAALYLNAVVSNGGTLSPTISAATDTLFVQLKGAGLYSKIFSFYPQLGALSATNKLNAKLNSSYDLVWNGGFTWTSSGSTGNGTNGYADPNITFNDFCVSPTSFHVLGYQNTSNTPTGGDEHMFGGIGSGGLIQLCTSNTGLGGDYFYRAGDSNSATITTSGQTGSFMINKSSTFADFWRNGNKAQTMNGGTVGPSGTDLVYVWALEFSGSVYVGSYANQTYSFLSFGEGLSDGEAANFQTIINTFQTSIGRNTY
jgi:hypothetical protein